MAKDITVKIKDIPQKYVEAIVENPQIDFEAEARKLIEKLYMKKLPQTVRDFMDMRYPDDAIIEEEKPKIKKKKDETATTPGASGEPKGETK